LKLKKTKTVWKKFHKRKKSEGVPRKSEEGLIQAKSKADSKKKVSRTRRPTGRETQKSHLSDTKKSNRDAKGER